MASGWKRDPVGFVFSVALLTFGFLLAGVTLSLTGADTGVVSELPEDEDVTVLWWITDGPRFYPMTYFFGGVALMLYVFRVLMKP